jgi:hypothetical protein
LKRVQFDLPKFTLGKSGLADDVREFISKCVYVLARPYERPKQSRIVPSCF